MYTAEENQIIQTYISFKFLRELHSIEFVKTDAYERLEFSDKFVHEQMKSIGVMSQGMIPPVLYMLLVMPVEISGGSLSKKYSEINCFISGLNINPSTNYSSDRKKVDYVRHMRNAISHMNVAYSEDGVVFTDSRSVNTKKGHKKKTEKFNVSMTYIDLDKIIEKLNGFFVDYIEEIKARQQKC